MLAERGSEIACLIMEPVMMNIGIVVPQPGYLESARDLCAKHGVVLIFDEVKSGATIAAGGATERFGVQPDLACFAKAIGGGTPIAAFGGTAAVMDVIEHGAAQQGTFNGNPLVCRGRPRRAHRGAHARRLRAPRGARARASPRAAGRPSPSTDIPAHTVDLGAKGCVSYRAEPLHNYRDFLETTTELFDASYPWIVNRGVFMTPGDEEQWTLSVQHTDADIDRYVDAFADFSAALSA